LFAAGMLLVAAFVTPVITRFLERFSPFVAARNLFAAQAFAAFATAATVQFVPKSNFGVWLGMGTVACLVSTTPPVVAAILPEIARGGVGLAAQNVLLAWTESLSFIAGPLLAAAMLGLSDNPISGMVIAFGVSGLIFLVSTLVLLGQARTERPVRAAPGQQVDEEEPPEEGNLKQPVHSVGTLKTLFVLTLCSYLVLGSLDVLYMPMAFDAGFGESGAGYIAGAYGFGGLISFVAARRVLGRPRLTPALVVLAVLGSLPLIALSFGRSNPLVTLTLIAITGAIRSIFGVVRQTLIQRSAPPGTFLRVTSMFQIAVTLGYAFGALIPWAAGNDARACLVSGLLVPFALVVLNKGLRTIDDGATVPVTEIALLGQVAIMRSLRPASLEALARHSHVRQYRKGLQIVHEGDVGQEMFVIIDGDVEVVHDDHPLACLSRGEIFGEVAVLRDQPRNATVRATSDVQLLAIPRADFVNFIGLHQRVAVAVEAVVAERSVTEAVFDQ
jgi:Cyclic nucleotide-binding domain/Major Facilitator Superfamily